MDSTLDIVLPAQDEGARVASKSVLNIGSGPLGGTGVHVGFRHPVWREVRLDIDPAVKPDLVGSITSMHGVVPDASMDAIWCSHSLEHLYAHEVVPALQECRRVLKGDGFALVTSPDFLAIAAFALKDGLDAVAYLSNAGPITALDMMFGHGASIAAGNTFMAHRTTFSAERLGRLAIEAGFAEARVATGDAFDVWGMLIMPGADRDDIAKQFADTNIARMFN